MNNDGQGEPLGVTPRLLWFNGEWYKLGDKQMKTTVKMANGCGDDSVRVETRQKPLEKTLRKHNRRKAVSAKERKRRGK